MSDPYLPAPPAPAPRPRKPKRWPWILGIAVAFGLGAAIGSGSSTPAPAAAPQSGSGAAVVAATATSAAAAPTPAPEPAGPKTSFGDGTYLVGTDIEVGSYKSSGPRDGGIPLCYWARLKDDSETNIIANSGGQGATRVTVKKGEYLKVTGCDFTKG